MDTVAMILKAADLSLKATQQSRSALQDQQVKARLDRISFELTRLLAKQDQSIVQEVHSSFGAINDAFASEHPNTRETYLSFAENSLLKHTALNPNLFTNHITNRHWIALAHFGLATICALRQDDVIAARHILRMFIADPENSRTNYAPGVFVDLFHTRCGDIYTLHDRIVGIAKDELDGKWGREDGMLRRWKDELESWPPELSGGYARIMQWDNWPDDLGPYTFEWVVDLLNPVLESNLTTRCSKLAAEYLAVS